MILVVLEFVFDKNDNLLAQYKKQYHGVDTCLALNEVLYRKDIDGVEIATPAETHYTLAREVLMAGKHVFVEKPIVLEEEHGEELLELANDGISKLKESNPNKIKFSYILFGCTSSNFIFVGELGGRPGIINFTVGQFF
jgi:hypothetical protein